MKITHRVLPFWQPWALLSVLTNPLTSKAYKQIETRPRNVKIRGEVLVYASKRWDNELRSICSSEPFLTPVCLALGIGIPMKIHDTWIKHILWPSLDALMPLGQIIGAVDFLDCGPIAPNLQILTRTAPFIHWVLKTKEPHIILPSEECFGDYSIGRHGIIMKNNRMLEENIPYHAHQGWNKFETNKPLQFI